MALEYIHSLGLMHQDIKPANIMIDKMLINLGDLGNMNDRELFEIASSSNTSTLRNPGGTKQYFPKEYF